MSVKERTYEFIKYKGIPISTFETLCDLSNGYISSMRKGFGADKLNNVLKAFPELNREWLLFGEGEMLLTDGEAKYKKTESSEKSESEHRIKYWRDIEATGGGLESFDDIKSDYVPLLLPDFHDCTDAVNIVGESMEPTYKSGSIILLKEWTEKFIEFGNVYLVITRNGNRMVKIIDPGSDAAHIICRSINTAFAPFEVERTDILRLYVVKGVISKSVM